MATVQIDSLAEYQEIALLTSKFKNFVYDSSACYPADPSRVAIACMGLAGELGEICSNICVNGYISSEECFRDEAGDYLYYVAELASACGITLEFPLFSEKPFVHTLNSYSLKFITHLTVHTGKLLDNLKKYIGHGRPFDREFIREELKSILDVFHNLLRRVNLTMQEVAQHNVDKLAKRHGEEYSESYYQSTSSCDAI